MAIPDGYATVTPWLISRDTPRLIDYVTDAFEYRSYLALWKQLAL